MKKTFLMLVFFCLTPFLRVVALDQTSMRMKGLGTNMQGIISDDYTDTIANPARERFWRQKQVIAKVGLYSSPISIGYAVGAIPVFLLAEGTINQSGATNNYYSSNPHYSIPTNTIANQYIYSYNSDRGNYSLLAMSGFGSTAFGVGFGLYYDESKILGTNDSLTGYKYIRGLNGETIYQTIGDQKTRSVSYMQNLEAVLGFHWRNESEVQKDKDLILRLPFSRNKARTSTKNNSNTDYDPDGDGNNDQYGPGNPISTPNKVSSKDFSTDTQNPAYRAGAGVEWRGKKISKNAKTGYLLSFSWQPAALRAITNAYKESQTVTGATTTTTINLDTLKQLGGKRNSYSGVLGFGGIWQVQEKVWIGLGLRAEGTIANTNTKQTTLNIYSGTLVDSFGSKLDSLSSTISFPLLFELPLTTNFTMRGNITSQWYYSKTEQVLTNLYFSPVKQTAITSKTSVKYGIGAGYQWKAFMLDIFTDYNPLTVSLYQLQLQCSYKF